MNYRWDWSVLWREPYGGWLLSGLGWTLAVTLGSFVVALAVGLPMGIAGRLPSRATRAVASVYVGLFRSVPPLVQLFLWYFVIPDLLPDAAGMWVKRDMPYPELTTASVAIGLFAAARVAEQVRAGLLAVEQRLLPVALASGLRPLQAFRLILLPLGLRRVIGPLTGEALVTMKLSSLSLAIGVLELTAQSRHIENETFQGFEAFTAATILYLVIGLGLTAVMGVIARRAR
jgi:glutamate/aspartate transport system permease protein